MYKVSKFGGSSLANAEKFRQVRKIVLSDNDRHIVVVSAMGKENSKDNKVTDLLYLIYQHRKYHVDATPLLEQVEKRYLKVAEELSLPLDLKEEFTKLSERVESDSISEEELVSRGEYFSAKLMASYLGFPFVDSKDLIFFDYDGKILEDETKKAIEEAYKKYDRFVVPGFYGSYPNGKIALFSRGGSDVTGSYMAKYSHASLYENFTDVSGFYMADPHIVENPRKIPYLSYDELRELSAMGANVIHPETILPLIDENIPLVILSTQAPEMGGTTIQKNIKHKHLITGITGKRGYLAFTFIKERSADKLDTMMKVLAVFQRFHIPVEHLPTAIDSFSVVVEKGKVQERLYDVLAELKKIPEIAKIKEEDDLALIAVVGENMVKKPGTSGRILSVFGEEGINIKLIDQGVEEFSIIVGVKESEFAPSLRLLYRHFASEKLPA